MSNEDFSETIGDLFSRAAKIDYERPALSFVRYASAAAHHKRDKLQVPIGTALAALFDLSVTALYLEKVATSGWYYCNHQDAPVLVYPFVNACPACTLNDEFVHLKARKPSSAQIGRATSTILAAFLDLRARSVKGRTFEVLTLNDNGIVDAILKGPEVLGLFEIKSAPLIAFPLEAPARRLTQLDDSSGELVEKVAHSEVNIGEGQSADLRIDKELRIPVGNPHDFGRFSHYQRIIDWLSNDENLIAYVNSWSRTFLGYADQAARSNTYWLTNGCGVPIPRPKSWPLRASQGHESISDGKSSVGLDRTDDLKKGIYQVLKMSTHYKEFIQDNGYEVFAALASNIHAVKHHDEYLSELEDVIWTVDGAEKSHVLDRDDTYTRIRTDRIYNLFDGIICFTRPHTRTTLLEEIYQLGN